MAVLRWAFDLIQEKVVLSFGNISFRWQNSEYFINWMWLKRVEHIESWRTRESDLRGNHAGTGTM